jgi:hypothetical protein
LSNCADNTPQQRARLRRTPTHSEAEADEHFFAELLTDYGMAVEFGDARLARFYLDECVKKYSEAVRR